MASNHLLLYIPLFTHYNLVIPLLKYPTDITPLSTEPNHLE